MFKKIYSFLILGGIAVLAYGGLVYNPMVKSNFDMIQTIEEEDGSPSAPVAKIIKVPNGSLTDNGDGTASLGWIASEADTLDTVSDRGATTDKSLTTGGIVVGDGDTVGATTNKWLFDDTGGDISTTGNIGIGTTSPSERLEVSGANTHIELTDTNAYSIPPSVEITPQLKYNSAGTYTEFPKIVMGKTNAIDGNTQGYMQLYGKQAVQQ